MASLLNGSHFNYVMVGTETDPNAVARVVLTAKNEKADSGSVVAGSNPVMMNGRPMVQPRTALQAAVMQPYQEMLAQQQAQQEAAENQQPITPVEPTAASSEPTAAAGSGASEGVVEAPPPAEAPRAGNGSGDKTPAQVLQDLYETRRQMMQQQHQPPPRNKTPSGLVLKRVQVLWRVVGRRATVKPGTAVLRLRLCQTHIATATDLELGRRPSVVRRTSSGVKRPAQPSQNTGWDPPIATQRS